MARIGSRNDDAVNPLTGPHVRGLEGGRVRARRQQRRRRLRNTITSGIGALVGLAVAATAVYVGYSIYDEQQASDRRESEVRKAELVEPAIGDVIDDLGEQPRWNGPGNPDFGVGED